jgi:DNA polymerase III epsilon subunit family exonuclease
LDADGGLFMLFPCEPPLRELPFAVIDLETTGGSPKAHWDRFERHHEGSEITEIGVVQLSGTVIQDRFTSLCAVERGVPPIIQRLTGITPAMLATAPPFEHTALQASTYLEGRIWVAHHAAFDGAFLKAYLPEGLWKRHRLICTRNLSRKLVPEAGKFNLAHLCEVLDLHNRNPHRALADAEATAELLKALLHRAEKQDLSAEQFLALGSISWTKL